MSKRNWVCFDCRSVVRREDYENETLVCATCSQPRVNLGYKTRIPARSRVKEWESLRERHYASQRATGLARLATARKYRRELEAEIENLESRPANPGRSRAVQLLRKRLRDLQTAAE
jgi:hypothetical protein